MDLSSYIQSIHREYFKAIKKAGEETFVMEAEKD